LGLFDAGGLAGKELTEIDLLAVEADAAARGHGDGLVVEGIVEVWQAPDIAAAQANVGADNSFRQSCGLNTGQEVNIELNSIQCLGQI